MGDIESILVIRLKALGDIVLSMPIIAALRERYPGAEIDYLCWERYAEALAGDTGLDRVIGLPARLTAQLRLFFGLRRRRFDIVLDLLSSPRSALITRLVGGRVRIGMDTGRGSYHCVLPRVIEQEGERVKWYTLESNLELVRLLGIWDAAPDAGGWGRDRTHEWRHGLAVGFPAAETERMWAHDYTEKLGVSRPNLVGIVPGTTYQAKSWPLESFIELTRILTTRMGRTVVVLWGPGEEELATVIVDRVPGTVKAPEMGIARLGALIGELGLLVTLDSGPKHLAVVQGVPTVTLFGPTDPCIWDPMTELHRPVFNPPACAPCRKNSCEPNRCLRDITAEQVAAIAAEVLETVDVAL
jgi:ADP-heptose:LPS heptosyltransferase